jgi:hypothetical protein
MRALAFTAALLVSLALASPASAYLNRDPAVMYALGDASDIHRMKFSNTNVISVPNSCSGIGFSAWPLDTDVCYKRVSDRHIEVNANLAINGVPNSTHTYEMDAVGDTPSAGCMWTWVFNRSTLEDFWGSTPFNKRPSGCQLV